MRINFKRLFLFIATLGMMSTIQAQMMPMPVDKDVRIGKLPNGLTYYIRHNETPKGQADFYIAQKVGSILEEDNQRGLAHFLEHMCFNGTENFPGNEVVSWLESIGVKFGQNLNAYTSVDETVYNISNVPTARVGVQDSCLMILHDWADGLLLDPEEIDKERGVIHEEWRRTNVGQMRILEKLLPVIYPNNRYGYRLPIGTMEVVDNFPPQAIRDYYEAWYRPDQQGIIVVGDIDVDRIENKIKEIFSPIKMPENVKERVYFPVEDTPGTIFAIGSDKELSFPIGMIMFKTKALPDSLRSTLAGVAQDYITTMIDEMLNSRLTDLSTKADAPFANAMAKYGNFLLAKTKDAFTITALPKGSDLSGALAAAYREVLRAARGGFTASEYERARKEYLSKLEKDYNDRANHQTSDYVRSYVRNFIDNNPIPSLEEKYNLMQMLANQVPVAAINMSMKELITPDNRVVIAMTPEKDGYTAPTEESLAASFTAIDGENIEAYVDEVKSEPLIPAMPKAGTIVKTEDDKQWGAEKWTLSNGATVVVKKTAFKNDEILFEAVAKGGGISTLPDEKANSVIVMPLALSQNGLGSYTFSDMQKYLQGKQASVNFSIEEYSRSLSGATTPKDLPTLMELIYMTMTDMELTEDEFTAFQNMYSGLMQNQSANPQFIFSKNLMSSLIKSPKAQMVTAESIKASNREDVLAMAHNATANAADYTFFFVGNIDTDSLKPLVEQYIASLPGDAAKSVKDATPDTSIEIIAGRDTHTFTAPMETPQTWAAIVVEGALPYSTKNRTLASVAGQILTKRLTETVREKEGAVYSIGAQGSMKRIGKYPVTIQSVFPMKPEMKEKVLGMVEAEFNNMTSNITDEELNKVKEFMVKSCTEEKELNEPWINAMVGTSLNGIDAFNNNIETINALTPADVMAFMKELLSQGNYQTVILDPEAE